MSGGFWLDRIAPRGGRVEGEFPELEVRAEAAAREALIGGLQASDRGFYGPDGEALMRPRSADGDRGGAALVGMMLAAISGGVVGFFLQGEAAQAVLLFSAAVSCGLVGWWARGA